MLRSSLAALTAICVMVGLGYAVADSEAEAKKTGPEDAKVHSGRQSFEKNCLQCHATYVGQYSFAPNLYGEMKSPHPKKSPAEVRSILKNGKGKMPSFADKLTPQEIEDLIAYMHTL